MFPCEAAASSLVIIPEFWTDFYWHINGPNITEEIICVLVSLLGHSKSNP